MHKSLDSAGTFRQARQTWNAERSSWIEAVRSGFITGCMPSTIALMIEYWSVLQI